MYLPCIKPSFKTVTDFSDRLCFVEALFPKGLHLLFKDVDTRDIHTRTMNTLLAVHIRSQSYHFTRFKWFYLALRMATALEEKTLLKGFGSLILLITWGTIIKTKWIKYHNFYDNKSQVRGVTRVFFRPDWERHSFENGNGKMEVSEDDFDPCISKRGGQSTLQVWRWTLPDTLSEEVVVCTGRFSFPSYRLQDKFSLVCPSDATF